MKLFLDSGDGKEEEAEFDRVLVAVGRKPLVRGLGVDELGIRLDPGALSWSTKITGQMFRESMP